MSGPVAPVDRLLWMGARLNLNTVRALGLAIQPSILIRAEQMIE